MSQVKRIGIPKPITDEIERIMGTVGYRTLTSFVVEATRTHLEKKRWEYEKKMAEEEERIVEKHDRGEESIGFEK